LIVLENSKVDIFLDTISPQAAPKPSKQGRKPKIDWEKLQVKAFGLLKDADKENLPKQEHIANLLRNWCQEEFDQDVGISTIQERLKPIYDMLKA